jgi:hypothetical protein
VTQPSCTACGGEDLEPGLFKEDDTGSYGLIRWVPAALERGFLGGQRLSKERWMIEVWRCSRCHHLELFAHEQV